MASSAACTGTLAMFSAIRPCKGSSRAAGTHRANAISCTTRRPPTAPQPARVPCPLISNKTGAASRWQLHALGEELTEACAKEWDRAAVAHPFIRAVGDGSITDEQFNTWLMQDYLFVVEFTRFAGRVLAKAPDEAGLQLILRSLCVLPDELTWFRETLEARGFDVEAVEKQPALQEYVAALEAWGESLSWAEALLAYYGIEHVYNSAWTRCVEAPEPYRTWAQRWGSPEFSAFCTDLGTAAEAALLDECEAKPKSGGLSPTQRQRATELFKEILRLEDGFWSMAFHTSA